jgi:tetratricopeptide (TPR) repeat protein
MDSVKVDRSPKIIPTYGLGAPEKNPLFFEKRVYQGSNGKVYPVPFIDKVFNHPEPRTYDAIQLENAWVRLVLLPEIGGRIFLGQDKTNRDYDFFYRQDVIKPALVGLAGPWISGGVEFNWPQHHRPGTYLPTDVSIQTGSDGSQTVWMSEHDPLNRLKGMHGICLRPGSALIELKGRLYNRTPLTQTFLWWANVAARVHDNYESFFPADVHYVADHAVRAMSSFPVAENEYYGLDYTKRPGANNLAWYKNIPVPTSYMVCQTRFDFFGGYDHDAGGGFLHIANRHISPGKKQWTWGNHEFGWAWDRELTDEGGPYVELMAGVYTDNQPDFSYLAPYETKTFSQYWWAYKKLGPVQEANTLAALRCVIDDNRRIELGLAVSRAMNGLKVVVKVGDRLILEETIAVSPEEPWQNKTLRFTGTQDTELCVWVFDSQGSAVIGYRPVNRSTLTRDREQATEPPMPEAIDTVEELYFTGEHLELYRHPSRCPEQYWQAALERDPKDVRSHIALGRKKVGRGLFAEAAAHFEKAIERLTFRHPNPETGEAHYFLGLALRFVGECEAAYPLLYKATWNYAWRSAAYYELAAIDLQRGHFETALEHARAALDTNTSHNKAIVVVAIALRKLGQVGEAQAVLEALVDKDPLDHWAWAELNLLNHGAAHLESSSRNDCQTALDVAFDYADCGCCAEAIAVMEHHHTNAVTPVAVPNPMARTPLTLYVLAWLAVNAGDESRASSYLNKARAQSSDYCFPSRLHEMIILEWALAQPGADRNAGYGLGNFYYNKNRHAEAISAWEAARDADPAFATVHRNLGLGYWNIRRDGAAARASYEMALTSDPGDSRLVAEFVQLCAKLGDAAAARLAFLEARKEQALDRDDATVEMAALYNETGQPDKALNLILSRRFHPWEGGEGRVLRQYTTACLQLGQSALESGDAVAAFDHFKRAIDIPDTLGEKFHLLQAKADVFFWQGCALRELGEEAAAIGKFEAAANESGDFKNMAVAEFSELTIFKALALQALGRRSEAETVFTAMRTHIETELNVPAKIDYFATSFPNLLVFDEDLNAAKRARQERLLNLVQDFTKGAATSVKEL